MPQTKVIFYQEENGTAPVLEWLTELKAKRQKSFEKSVQLLQDLGRYGHELQFPTSSNLGEGLYELRAHDDTVQLRIFYFFDSRQRHVAVAVHGIRKENKREQDKEIKQAHKRRLAFLKDPDAHTYRQSERQDDEDDN